MMLFDYVTVIPECVPKNFIDLYLSLEKNNITRATVKTFDESSDNTKGRYTFWIPVPDEIIMNTGESIKSLYYTKLIKKYQQTIKFIEPPQFLYYTVGGTYEFHNDSENFVDGKLSRVLERDVTILIYLNDNYEGGELVFPEWGVAFKPKQGTLIAFPSYIEFSHTVRPVTSGERYTIVSWICTNDRIYTRPY